MVTVLIASSQLGNIGPKIIDPLIQRRKAVGNLLIAQVFVIALADPAPRPAYLRPVVTAD